MKVGLAVHRAGHDREANVRRMVELAEEGAASAADLVLFCEAAPTALCITDDSAHDLSRGEAIPGPAIAALRAAARRMHIWIGFGLLERAGGRLYDSAALIDRHGRLRLHYRRIDPQWHGPRADPTVYGEGHETPVLEDEFGRMGFLIGGDVFNDGAMGRMWAQRPDVVLVPNARGLDAGMHGDDAWSRTEQAAYAERFKAMNTSGLAVSCLAADDESSGCVGGAAAVDSQGRIVAELPAGAEAVLVAKLD
ncbi:MAG: carbon-nitrogen hydrolase family protein [Candidatus Dormibacteraeota bacterium]|nr:carbon-nitrogen hydrolase family protein [Candidatus Dormibacteraeota bacterium]